MLFSCFLSLEHRRRCRIQQSPWMHLSLALEHRWRRMFTQYLLFCAELFLRNRDIPGPHGRQQIPSGQLVDYPSSWFSLCYHDRSRGAEVQLQAQRFSGVFCSNDSTMGCSDQCIITRFSTSKDWINSPWTLSVSTGTLHSLQSLAQPLRVNRFVPVREIGKYCRAILLCFSDGWKTNFNRRFPEFYKRSDDIAAAADGIF